MNNKKSIDYLLIKLKQEINKELFDDGVIDFEIFNNMNNYLEKKWI